MGYSARYHATSLIAVFLALAIGILIGAEFGGDALTSARRTSRTACVSNLQDARTRPTNWTASSAASNEFADRVYPALTRDRLAGHRVAIVGSAGSTTTPRRVEERAGAERATGRGRAWCASRSPPNVVAGDGARTRFAGSGRDDGRARAPRPPDRRRLAGGSKLVDDVGPQLFSRFSGELTDVSRIVLVPSDLGDLEARRAREHPGAALGHLRRRRVRRRRQRRGRAQRYRPDPARRGERRRDLDRRRRRPGRGTGGDRLLAARRRG